MFRIRSDPCNLAGSGFTSGNVDPNPGKKINRETHIKINQNYKNIIKKNHYFLNFFEFGSDPDPLFPEVAPRSRIHIKMKWIRKTDFVSVYLLEYSSVF